MNFGQALAAMHNGRSISNLDWDRPGMSLTMQERTGMVTEAFIVQTQANGICRVYSPSQADILGNNWETVGEAKMPATQGVTQNAAQGIHEHAGSHSG